MTYTLQEQYTSKNFTAAANVSATFGVPRTVESITIHHWGNKGQQFDIVRDFLCTNNTPTSAHYVVQDGLVACIVSPDDAAWHSGNPIGNAASIGIECRPEATDGDYATVAELIANIRAIYGDIPLRPHNFWFNTACPGDYDLARLDSLARGTAAIAPQGTITQEEPLVPNESDKVFYHLDGGEKISLNEFLNDLIREARSSRAATQALLSVQLPDPSEPGKTYSLADYIVWAATNAKNAAGAAAVAAGNTSPEALAKAVSEAQTGATAQAVADQLQISVKGK